MTSAPYIEECIDWIARQREVSWPELERWLTAHGMDVEGEYAMFGPDSPDVIIWAGMSEAFCDFAQQLNATRRTELEPLTAVEMLIIHGYGGDRMLGYPIAESRPPGGYHEQHWAPSVIRPRQDRP